MRFGNAAWLGAAVLAAGCVFIWDDARLTIHNRSSSILTEVRLGDGGSGWWGPNLLDGVLMPGADTVTSTISCGDYDVQVADAAGRRCQVDRVYICTFDRDLIVDAGMMSGCALPR